MKSISSRIIFITVFVLVLSSSAFADVSSYINGDRKDWKLLFGNSTFPVEYIPKTGTVNKIPIILVHGNNNENANQAGWETFVSRIPPSNKYDIWIWVHDTSKAIGFNGAIGTNSNELADCIFKYILPYYTRNTKVILIAHSRGGLVCRSFMNYDFDRDGQLDGEKVRGLITLGTPHHGSPLAVPDWAAFYFSTIAITPPSIFDLLYGPGKIFSTDRIGTINLAWDNMDFIIPFESYFTEYNTFISYNGRMYLSPRDSNDNISFQFTDYTMFYKDQWTTQNYKSNFGTLSELNKNEKFREKIVCFAAYGKILPDIVIGFLERIAACQLFKEISSSAEHQCLNFLNYILAGFAINEGFDKNKGTPGGINYFANDGMVPLQSALFLNISDQDKFSSQNLGIVSIDEARVALKKQVKKMYYFGEPGLTDHLHLLDTTNEKYWAAIKSVINEFASNKVSDMISSLLLKPAQIIKKMPVPGNIQELDLGIEHDGKNLWIPNSSRASQVKVHKINPADGSVLGSYDQKYFSYYSSNVVGLAYDSKNNYLYNQVFPNGTFYAMDLATLTEVSGSKFILPFGWIHDLAIDSTSQIIWAITSNARIYKIAPNGSVLGNFTSPDALENPQGITWDGSNIWVTLNGYIYKIDQNRAFVDGNCNSSILRKISLEEINAPTGRLTYDGRYFWTKDNNFIYQLEIF